MRIGVYGGSFDPIHIGHLLLAETARAEQNLDRVDFVPLGVPPHLKDVRTDGETRIAMLSAALAPYPCFDVSRFEIDSSGVSYTVDTLRHYRELYPRDELFLILSSETFNDLPNWRDPEAICKLASIIVARRAGYPPPDFDAASSFISAECLAALREREVTMPLIEVSSSSIRARVASGKSVRFMTPDVVVDLIVSNGLYQR
jgi:nicotinate-nucleotide adenylyltransferase